MVLPALVLAAWLVPCCSVSGKPEQTGLRVRDPGGKKSILFKKQHANTSSYLVLCCWGLLWSDWLTCWTRQTQEGPFSSCLAQKPLAVAVPVRVGSPWVHLNKSLPGWNFTRMLYLPSIKCQKRRRVCVFLCESGLHFSSICCWGT